MNLTPESIRAIDAIADPVGVLSLYGDGPAAAMRRSPADRALALRRRLQRVEAGLREAGTAALADRYRRWLPRIESQLFRLAHASSPGAAVFLPLSSGRPLRVDLPMPVGEHARLEPTGHVMPLVAAHDEGRPAGVVVARRSSVQVLEWRQGRIDEELEMPIPSRARGSDRHRWGGRGYRIDAVAEGLRRVVEQRGWRRLLIAGDPRLRSAVACGRPLRHDVEVRTLACELEGMSADLAVSVAADLDAAQRQYEWRLVERVLDAALYDQSAVLGADAVVAALELGLVEHLVIDPSRVASDAPPPRTAAAERMAELALASGAEITPLEGTGARLADVGGVAALLR
ncbi:MAG: hypothetical protein ACHQEA_05420 [Gaiellales bacterium]